MTNYKDYLAVCPLGHRSYLRLAWVTAETKGRCTTCGQPAELLRLPPPR